MSPLYLLFLLQNHDKWKYPMAAAAPTTANNINKIHTNNTPTPTNSTGSGGMSYIDVVNNAAAAAAAAAGMPPHGVAPQYDMGQQTKSLHHPGAEHLVYMPNMAAMPPQHHYLAQSLAAAQQLQQHQQMPHMRPQQQVGNLKFYYCLIFFSCCQEPMN